MKLPDTLKQHTDLPAAVLLAAVLLAGGFHEAVACGLSVILLACLTVRLCKTGRLTVRGNLVSLAVAAIAVGYGVTALWAVDPGMAPLGFLKFLPVCLYLLVLMQEPNGGEKAFRLLPYAAAVITAVSAVGMQIPALASLFSVAGRLAGTFQYPNTFALFLLVAELLLLAKPGHRWPDAVVAAVLVFGLLYTGSRTVLLLGIAANIAMLFAVGGKRLRLAVLIGFGGAALIVAAAALFFPEAAGVFTRLLTVSVTESTFVGRFLYMSDALPLVLRYPFGTGYLGYYYLQQSIQTGVYAVRSVHNDFLQLLLDVGVIPFVLFAAAVVRSLIQKGRPLSHKIILCVICLHSCFDFDLQFTAVFFLLLLFLNDTAGREWVLRRKAVGTGAAAALAALSLYGGTVQTLQLAGQYTAAHALYPWDTQVQIGRLTAETDPAAAAEIADDILTRNEYVAVAYSAKARAAYALGDFGGVMAHKQALFDRAPFAYEEYEEYARMLIIGISLYEQAGDEASVLACKQELVTLRRRLHGTANRLSELGKRIDDQPVTAFPADIDQYINEVEAGL